MFCIGWQPDYKSPMNRRLNHPLINRHSLRPTPSFHHLDINYVYDRLFYNHVYYHYVLLLYLFCAHSNAQLLVFYV